MPARLARATASASSLGVGDPDRGAVERQLGRHRQADRARPGAEIGDETRRRKGRRQLDRDACHQLGLGPRDQHAPIDRQVERAEPPSAEHVLQRFAGAVAGDHAHRGGRPSDRWPARRGRPRARRRRGRRHLAQPSRLVPRTHRRAVWAIRSPIGERVSHRCRRAAACARPAAGRRRRGRDRRRARRSAGTR